MFRRGEPFFYAFDLLWLNGQDLRGLRLLGVIYLDSSVPGAFQTRHLNLQIAIASVAALALNHWRYIALLEGKNQRNGSNRDGSGWTFIIGCRSWNSAP